MSIMNINYMLNLEHSPLMFIVNYPSFLLDKIFKKKYYKIILQNLFQFIQIITIFYSTIKIR